MHSYTIYLIPVITAFIGWLTNWVAIRMLFRPRKPWNFCGIRLQGLVPKNQHRFAEKIATIVERELINRHTIQEQLEKVNILPYLDEAVKRLVHHTLANKLKEIPFLGSFINEGTLASIEGFAKKELHKEAGVLLHHIAANAESHLDVRTIVADKISRFNLHKLEQIVLEVSKKELRVIEYLGGVLGLLVGLVQLALVLI